jgi:membrane-bound lytic murein transglycosylase F
MLKPRVRPLTPGPARRMLVALLVPLLLSSVACEPPEAERDLADIIASDTLVVATRFNSTSYFLYRGEPMGYEYELLRRFAEEHDVQLRMVVARDFDEMRELLRTGEADILAARLFPDGRLEGRVAFTEPLFETQRVLVQRSAPPEEGAQTEAQERALTDPDWGFEVPEEVTVRARLVQRPAELAGETVYVAEESGAHRQLIELSDSIDGSIEVVELDADVMTETLIRQVAAGVVEFTVSRENLALLKQEAYTNIEVLPVIGPPVGLVWAVRRGAPELLRVLDEWIAGERDGETFNAIYRKYYSDRRGYRERELSDYLTAQTGRLSEWDDLILREATAIGWDWRLLASLMYQESLFNPRARSWAGAMGLLQLMPATAREVGVRDPWDPEDNVAGGARYLQWLEGQWEDEVPDPNQRLRFVLASYNVGRGHVMDAQRLAGKHGDDPLVWDQVAHWLLMKSKREFFTDPVVRFGYARGLEPVTYVRKILDRYQHYQQFVTERPALGGGPRGPRTRNQN